MVLLNKKGASLLKQKGANGVRFKLNPDSGRQATMAVADMGELIHALSALRQTMGGG